MISSKVIEGFFPALKSELAPFVFFPSAVFDESLQFDNAAHSDWVMGDSVLKELSGDRNLVMMVWNRTPLQPNPELSRRGLAYQEVSTESSIRFFRRNALNEITVSFICPSPTIGELLEEWMLTKDLYKLKGVFSFDVAAGSKTPPRVKEFEWVVSAFRLGTLQKLDSRRYGTMVALSVGFTVSYPIILSQEIVKVILQIDQSTFLT